MAEWTHAATRVIASYLVVSDVRRIARLGLLTLMLAPESVEILKSKCPVALDCSTLLTKLLTSGRCNTHPQHHQYAKQAKEN